MSENLNLADEGQVKEQRSKLKRDQERELACWRQMLKTVEGREVLNWIIEITNLHMSAWDPSSRIHYRTGAHDVGRVIIEKIIQADRSIGAEMLLKIYGQRGAE